MFTEYGEYLTSIPVAGRAIGCSIDSGVVVESGSGLELYFDDDATNIDCYVIEHRSNGEYVAVCNYFDPDLADLDMDPFVGYVVCKATSFANVIESIHHDLKKHLA